MDSLNKRNTVQANETINESISEKSHVVDAANELLNESKKLANELYEEGLSKINMAEEQFKEYSDLLLKKIQEKPLTSVLIAGGVGFLLTKLIKK